MILHASINFFNGEEFLEACVRNLEGVADIITILWQDVSYRGNPISQEAMEALSLNSRPHSAGNIHQVHYQNDGHLTGHQNETAKRNLGLDTARQFGATHHMDMDVDEFYFKPELEYAKKLMEENDLDSAACRIYEYHGDIRWRCPKWRLDMYVALIHKIHPETRFDYEGRYPVRIDPTRRVSTHEKFYVYEPQEVCMHHYTLVRKDMYRAKMIDSNGYGNNVRRMRVLGDLDEANYEIVPDYFGIES